MWSKQTLTEAPPAPGQKHALNVAPFTPAAPAPAPARLTPSPLRSSAHLGSSLHIKGQITGSEDLQIDGSVDGPILLEGCALTVGPTAQLNSEIHAGEVVVSGKAVGNVHARGRVEITKDGSVTGDIACARISIEDGAHFKGRIEIDPARYKASSI